MKKYIIFLSTKIMFRLLEILFVVKLYAHTGYFLKSVLFRAAMLIWFFETNGYYDLVLLIKQETADIEQKSLLRQGKCSPQNVVSPSESKNSHPPRNSF